jgi:hypothetical protein
LNSNEINENAIMVVRKCPILKCDFKHTKGFFNIPEHPVRRKAWAEACKLPPSSNKPICWQHFKISDFKKEITKKDLENYTFGQLKKDTVPSQRLPSDPEENVDNQSQSPVETSTENTEIEAKVAFVS